MDWGGTGVSCTRVIRDLTSTSYTEITMNMPKRENCFLMCYETEHQWKRTGTTLARAQ